MMDDTAFSEFLDESIPLWRDDPVMFFREVLNFEPDEWQAAENVVEEVCFDQKSTLSCLIRAAVPDAYFHHGQSGL